MSPVAKRRAAQAPAVRSLETDATRRREADRDRQRWNRARKARLEREAEGLGDVDLGSIDLAGLGANPEDGAAILEAFRRATSLKDLRARLRAAFDLEPIGLEGLEQ